MESAKSTSSTLKKSQIPLLEDKYLDLRKNIFNVTSTWISTHEKEFTELLEEYRNLKNTFDRKTQELKELELEIADEKEALADRKEELLLLKEIKNIRSKAQHDSYKKLKLLHDGYQDKLSNAKVTCKLFEERLGLVIQHKANNTKFLFECITNEERGEHYIEVCKEGDLFQVHSCVPEIPNIQELVQKLNYTGNLSRFIRSVRSSFVNLYN